MNIRKILIGAIALIMTCSAMSGCAKKTDDKDSKPTVTNPVSTDEISIAHDLGNMEISVDDHVFTIFESTAADIEKYYSFVDVDNLNIKHNKTDTVKIDVTKAGYDENLYFAVKLTNFGDDDADYKTYTVTGMSVYTDLVEGNNNYPLVVLADDIMWTSTYADIVKVYGEPLVTNVINDAMYSYGYEFEINTKSMTCYYSVTLQAHNEAGLMNVNLDTRFQIADSSEE